jgi:pimeloyl-ACP methyl ester carboxylesterase
MPFVRLFKLIIGLLAIAVAPAAASAQTAAARAVSVTSGVRYELIGRWDVARLNRILTTDTPKFFGIDVVFTPARNAVRLYRITYNSVVPEMGNKPIVATGLLAVPDTAETRFPLVSYQHGTVYGKQEVPSFPEQSPETQLMIAQFAGQGYLVIGADYFGMGTSGEPEGYMVKASHQQATYDMLVASRAVLDHMKLAAPKLFISGWSQGGFVTMAFLEKLEQLDVPVAAAATASAPLDVMAALNGYLSFPRKNDAKWLSSLFILSSFAFEKYYQVPGLARAVLTDESYEISRKAYERQPFDPADVPTDLHKLVRPEYFDAKFFAGSIYGRLLADAQAYRWVIKNPVRNYFGDADEAITPGVGQLAMTYQRAMGSGNTTVEAISTGNTGHRGTYATAVPAWKRWFDSK